MRKNYTPDGSHMQFWIPAGAKPCSPIQGLNNGLTGNPDDWTANKFGPGASPVMQTTPAHNGNLALKGEVIPPQLARLFFSNSKLYRCQCNGLSGKPEICNAYLLL